MKLSKEQFNSLIDYIRRPTDSRYIELVKLLVEDDSGVHNTHCCKKHGCKYNEDDCPVAYGDLKGIECEYCMEKDDEGWIEHDGSICPIKDGIKFIFKCRNGYTSEIQDKPSIFAWEHYGKDGDIMSYRIIKEEATIKCIKEDKPNTKIEYKGIEVNGVLDPVYNPETHYLVPYEWSDENRIAASRLMEGYGICLTEGYKAEKATKEVFGGKK
jgi:hypothetical protein